MFIFSLFLVSHHSRALSSILTLTLSFVFIFIEIYYCCKDHLSGPKKCPLLLFGALHFNHLSFRDPRPLPSSSNAMDGTIAKPFTFSLGTSNQKLNITNQRIYKMKWNSNGIRSKWNRGTLPFLNIQFNGGLCSTVLFFLFFQFANKTVLDRYYIRLCLICMSLKIP